MSIISANIDQAISLLQQGNVIGIPTETVYGLAANALDPAACVSIFEIKERPSFDPLIVHVPSIGDVARYASDFPPTAKLLAEKFWPGPLTLLLPKRNLIPDIVTAGLDTVGLRCPDHALTRTLLQRLDFPLAAPSANPFGYISPTNAQHVQDQLGDKIPFILDGGPCHIGLESTIVGFEEGQITIHRLGGLAVEDIEAVVGNVKLNLNSSSNPKAPGQLSSHYAPKKQVIIGNIVELMKLHYGKKVGVLAFKTGYPVEHAFVLSQTGSLPEAAQHIFGMLRALDQSSVELILAEYVPAEGIGRAINDRLQRAAKTP